MSQPSLHAPRLAMLGALLAVLAACSPAATASGTAEAARPSPSATAAIPPTGRPTASDAAGPAQLLLEARSEGGFINPAATIGALPLVVVDADGRVYTPAAPVGGSTPLIPPVEVRDTGAAGAAAILAAAEAAGLADGTAVGGVAADTGSTVFTLELRDAEVVTRVSALGPVIGRPGHPVASGDPSAGPGTAALRLLAELTDASVAWAGAAPIATVYRPTAYRLWVAPDAGGAPEATAPWPLPGDPASFGAAAAASLGVDGLRSGVVADGAAVTLAGALRDAVAGTDVVAGGRLYRVWVRPVLPDELGG